MNYLTNNPNNFQFFEDRKNFVNLLQFLIFVLDLDYTIDSLRLTFSRLVTFPIQDFFRYQRSTKNYYQFKKLLQFFRSNLSAI